MKIGIKMDKLDNVAVVIEDIAAGEIIRIDQERISTKQVIPRGHKMALTNVNEGEYIIKYGVPIGRAKVNILAGEHVHVQNVKDITGEINSVR